MEAVTDNTKRYSVLLVDDEANILQSLQRLLRREPYLICTAQSGHEALEILERQEQVAVIISDQRMPTMNGTEFLRRSQLLAPDATRILMTGYSDLDDTIAAINQGGASRYLHKPWHDAELLQAILEGVRVYGLKQENRCQQEIIRQQNAELQDWNTNLKERVLQQTAAVTKKADELHEALLLQRQTYNGLIVSFLNLVEMRGTRLHQHARNVANLASSAAHELGLMPEEQEQLKIAGLLHDIGEIGIPERIFESQPELMRADDFQLYARHPVRGQMAIDNIVPLRRAGVLIRHHHEHYNGSGFPDQLAGEEIPFGARILAYADQIDCAMRQGAETIEHALTRVELGLSTKLDPALKNVFRKVARYVYFSMPEHDPNTTIELELRPDELQLGMLLSRNLFSGTGLLLLNRGIVLDATKIESIQRYYHLDPAQQGIFVLLHA
jgi:response regulator RpfG family c-di-GMP phosphodiesterase